MGATSGWGSPPDQTVCAIPPSDMASFFSGDTIDWGLLNRYGAPKKTYYSFLAFNALVHHPVRLAVEGDKTGETTAVAGLSSDRHEVAVMLRYFGSSKKRIELTCDHLPWNATSEYEMLVLDDARKPESLGKHPLAGSQAPMTYDFSGPGVILLYVRRRPS